MPNLDEIIDRVAEACGADFAFVLSRRGRLVTRNAPKDMPEAGRLELVALAEELLDGRRSGVPRKRVERRELVPYGGRGPLDVYVAARKEAILCVALGPDDPQSRVGVAIAQGLVELDALLEVESGRRDSRRERAGRAPSARRSEPGGARATKAPPAPKSERGSKVPPARKSSPGGRRSVPPPPGPGRHTIPFLEVAPKRKITPPPMPPVITVGEAKLGRHTLAAIELDAEGPEITLGEASIGRATMAEIDLSDLPRGDARSSLPEIRVELASLPDLDRRELDVTDRQTLPFVEPPSELLRQFEAAGKSAQAKGASGREASARGPTTVARSPQRTVVVGSSPDARDAGRHTILGLEPDAMRSPRDSNVEAWRSALEELVEGEGGAGASPAPPAGRGKKR